MHDDAEAWVVKAEGDYTGAVTLAKKRSNKVAHLTCFAAQQCAEKYLKAFLVEHNVTFPKTHDLTKELLPRCLSIDSEFSVLLPHLELQLYYQWNLVCQSLLQPFQFLVVQRLNQLQ